jgi:hypothetical protein
MEAAQAAFRSVLEHCSNVLKKISTTFQNLDERQKQLECNEAVPLIVPILTNIETQLSPYDNLAAVFHVSAVQTTQIAMLEAELETTRQQLSSSRELVATMTTDNDRLNIELAKARESLAQRPPAMLPAAQMTPNLQPSASSNANFSARQFPPTPTSASTDFETSTRIKRQLTSPIKTRDQSKRMRPNVYFGRLCNMWAGSQEFAVVGRVRRRAAADRDLLSLSAKTRISQLRSQQIDHHFGPGHQTEGQLV